MKNALVYSIMIPLIVSTLVSSDDLLLQHAQHIMKWNDSLLSVVSKASNHVAKINPIAPLPSKNSLSLFKAFPQLSLSIAHIPLAHLPTPLIECSHLAQALSIKKLYIKCDNLTGARMDDTKSIQKLFGGNKVRKLEFLLGQAHHLGAQSVITFGCAGSNHAAATAVYARQLGLHPILCLAEQENSSIVHRNLLIDASTHAEIVPIDKENRASTTAYYCIRDKVRLGSFPYIIPVGGSCPLGVIGFVNAAFELKEQIATGLMPMPEVIYIALGSAGTTAGLLLGIKAAKLPIKIVAVAVEEDNSSKSFMQTISTLFKDTNQLLFDADNRFGIHQFNENDLEIMYDCYGQGYSFFSPEAMYAIKLCKQTENVVLDGVYSGKAFAGLVKQCIEKKYADSTVLFWNTFCDDAQSWFINPQAYEFLPAHFQHYFHQPLQVLENL